jgi:hypothetical protein
VREPHSRAGRRAPQSGPGVADVLGSGVVVVARLIMTVAVLLIGLAIVLRDIGANPANTIIKGLHECAAFFAGAFTGLISFHGHPKRAITFDWGIAAIVYLIAGAVISGYVRRITHSGCGRIAATVPLCAEWPASPSGPPTSKRDSPVWLVNA